MNMNQQKLAKHYQPLFDLMKYKPLMDFMSNEYGLELTFSEVDKIILTFADVSEAINELMKPLCDVEGCNLIPSCGGVCWRDTGYWSVCSYHSAQYRNGKSQPKMKQEAIEREASRLPNGCLPS